MKKIIILIITLISVCSFAMVGCQKDQLVDSRIVDIAITSNNLELWTDIRDDFNKAMNGQFVAEISVAENPESVLESSFSNGSSPDVILLPTGRGKGFTEELILNRAIYNLDDLLQYNVFGEDVKLKDKFLNGFLSTSLTNPYQMNVASEQSTYMLPLLFDVNGLFYNKDLMKDNNGDNSFKLPKNWEEYLNLRPSVTKANLNLAENDKLFMYGYDESKDNKSIIAPTIASYCGNLLAERMLNYDYIYNNVHFAAALRTFADINSLLSTGETESGIGNYVLDNNALQALINKKLMFLAGGKDTLKKFEDESIQNFDIAKLGFVADFAASNRARRYALTDMQQIYIPKQAHNIDGAKQFLLYLFSNRASDILLDNGNLIPTKYALANADNKIDAKDMLLYNVFADDSVYPCSGEEAFVDKKQFIDEQANWDTVFIDNFTTYALMGRNTQVWTDNLKTSSVLLRSAYLQNR